MTRDRWTLWLTFCRTSTIPRDDWVPVSHHATFKGACAAEAARAAAYTRRDWYGVVLAYGVHPLDKFMEPVTPCESEYGMAEQRARKTVYRIDPMRRKRRPA